MTMESRNQGVWPFALRIIKPQVIFKDISMNEALYYTIILKEKGLESGHDSDSSVH